ncbi:caprin-2 isoform X2 [Nelusetta ayraudi]|uniref:caprin-2 isoform X2 n=1 Tax=Nelusetta ayraudi TaxID=303726 RepID=UPI003F72F41F
MVQLSPFLALDVAPPPDNSEGGGRALGLADDDDDDAMSEKETSAVGLSLETPAAYQGYETYIEDGLICLKHKVRNLEKKKLKLEDYKKRLSKGEVLNKDQMVAVEKYEEVLHHLQFARDIHRTLDSLTQSLLRAQKKVVKREQMAKTEAERRRLSTVLQVQQVLHGLQQEHIRRDLLTGCNHAPLVPAQRLHSLTRLTTLLGGTRDTRLTVEEQMEQAAVAYSDLLDGKDKPVVGSTFKLLKEELTSLLNCKYFSHPPPAPSRSAKEVLSSDSTGSKLKTNEASKESWREDLQASREREPPDCWDVESCDGTASPSPAVRKTWKGAATLIPKVPGTTKKQSAGCKQEIDMSVPVVEVFSSPPALPKDPILRKQHLEDLMTKIHGSFSFMQDSLLDGEISPSSSHSKLRLLQSGSPSPPLAQTQLESPADLPKTMHSTPLPARLLEHKAALSKSERCLQACDLEISSKSPAHEPLPLAERKKFPSPPLYRRESTISISLEDKSQPHTPVTRSGGQSPCDEVAPCASVLPQGQTFSTPPTRHAVACAHFQNIQSNGEVNYKKDTAVFPEPKYSTASTQTPPEFAPSEEDPQPAYQSDYTMGNGGQMFLSPGQSGNVARHGQSYYTSGSVRGTARGGRGLAQNFRSPGWHRGGAFISQTHFRESGPVFYHTRDSGYQHYRRGGGPHVSSVAWSDSSPVSSPDREGAFATVDSGQGDSLSVSTVEVPVTPHGQQHTAVLPMQLYPLTQPLHVAFTASRTANFAPGNLDQPIVFDQLHSNLGEMYDAHIGRFTCPIGGTYVFMFHILKLAVNVPLYINLMRNDEVVVSGYANDGAPDHETASNHAILPLFQGDQVWLRLHRGAIYGSTWKYSTFSGFLLYQD